MRLILAIIFLWLLTACSEVQKLRRAERLLEQAGRLGAKWKSDTVFQERLVYVPQVTHDTTFVSQPGDTVTITKDRLQVKYVRLPGDSVFIEGTCLPDTVRISVPVTVTRTISAGYTKWQLIGSVLGGILFVGLMAFGAYKIAGLVKSSAKSG